MNIEIKISKKRVDYIKAVKYLEKRHAQVLNNKKPELIWILEHPPVFTAGISYEEKHLLDKNQNVITTDRGGKITYHGPGQIIFYTIINLNTRKRDIRWFINVLENTIIDTLRFYKIDSVSNRKKIGIWVKHKQKQKKIATESLNKLQQKQRTSSKTSKSSPKRPSDRARRSRRPGTSSRRSCKVWHSSSTRGCGAWSSR